MVLAWAKLWEFTIEQKVQKKTMFLLIRFQSQRIVQYWNISYSKWGMQVQILQWLLQPFPWKILSGDDINVAKIHYLLDQGGIGLHESAFKKSLYTFFGTHFFLWQSVVRVRCWNRNKTTVDMPLQWEAVNFLTHHLWNLLSFAWIWG